jgi:hypothetical protein
VKRMIAFWVISVSLILSLSAVLSAAACLAPVLERRSGLLLAAEPGPHSARQSAVPQEPLEVSRPRHHRTAITPDTPAITDILAIMDTRAITAIRATTATTNSLS